MIRYDCKNLNLNDIIMESCSDDINIKRKLIDILYNELGVDLMDAKTMIEYTPSIIIQGINITDANDIKEKLESLGAYITIRPTETEYIYNDKEKQKSNNVESIKNVDTNFKDNSLNNIQEKEKVTSKDKDVKRVSGKVILGIRRNRS